MKLTKKQIRKLSLLREQRDVAPTIPWLFRSNLYRYLALIGLCSFAICFYLWLDYKSGTIFFSGFFFAIFMREFQLLRRHVIDWPIINETTNWVRINELLPQSD